MPMVSASTAPPTMNPAIRSLNQCHRSSSDVDSMTADSMTTSPRSTSTVRGVTRL